jgi:hypothetical protein
MRGKVAVVLLRAGCASVPASQYPARIAYRAAPIAPAARPRVRGHMMRAIRRALAFLGWLALLLYGLLLLASILVFRLILGLPPIFHGTPAELTPALSLAGPIFGTLWTLVGFRGLCRWIRTGREMRRAATPSMAAPVVATWAALPRAALLPKYEEPIALEDRARRLLAGRPGVSNSGKEITPWTAPRAAE